MGEKRKSPFSLSQRPFFPFGKASVVPTSDRSTVAHVAKAEKIKAGVKADLTEFAGNDSSFVLYGQPALLRFPAIGVPLVVATFTVPPGRTLEIDRIDWWCSEPFLYGNQQFGWRPAINGNQIPFWSSQTPAGRPDYMQLPLAPSTGNEPRFSPVYLYAESVLTIEIVELTVAVDAFNSNVWVATYVYGTLRKPGGVG
jgi:hypothetical protein